MKTTFQKWLPPFLMLVMALWFFGNLQAPKNPDFAYNEFGRLPITANGRIVPLDSVARNALLEIREKQTLNAEPWKAWNEKPRMVSATEWLANVMMNPTVADAWPVFRLDNPDLISLLKLPDKGEKSDGKHYSWNQLQPALETLDKENTRVQAVESANRTAYENAIANLHQRAMRYISLRNAVQPGDAQDWPAELAAYEQLIPAGVAALTAQQAGKEFDKTNFNSFVGYIERFQFMASLETPLILPPNGGRDWRRMGDALLDAPRPNGVKIDRAVRDWATMAGALDANQPESFNAALRDLRSQITTTQPKAMDKARAEVLFNQMQPFYNSMVIYILAGLLAIFSWFNLSETLRRSSVWLVWLAFAIHTTGLVYRMVLEGRR